MAIARLMELNPKVTYADISFVTGFSDSKTFRVIQSLREKGAVERVGSRKVGSWRSSKVVLMATIDVDTQLRTRFGAPLEHFERRRIVF